MTFDVVTDPRPRLGGRVAASSFVGRRGEIRELRTLLSDRRLVTLTGPGGVGKSRLAHHTAATLRRVQGGETYCVDLVEAHDEQLLTQELQDPELLAHLVAGALQL